MHSKRTRRESKKTVFAWIEQWYENLCLDYNHTVLLDTNIDWWAIPFQFGDMLKKCQYINRCVDLLTTSPLKSPSTSVRGRNLASYLAGHKRRHFKDHLQNNTHIVNFIWKLSISRCIKFHLLICIISAHTKPIVLHKWNPSICLQ